MTFWLMAASIALSVFACVAFATSAGVTFLASFADRRTAQSAPSARAALLFRLRLLPGVAAGVMAFGIALPIFLVYEPGDSGESVALTLLILGAAGAGLIARGAYRAAAAWRATNRVRREWQARGRRIEGFDIPLPLYAIDEPFPTVAVVGVKAPALFISERVLRECPADEVRAMLRHEAAHVAVRDNLKRFAIRACPDLLGPGSPLDRAWSSAAEEAADAAAVAGRPAAALDLADALIRVARLAPSPTPALASSFYPGGSIESRVRRLLAPAPAANASTPSAPVVIALGAVLCASAAAIVMAAPALHQFMETLVSQLP